MFCRNCGKQLYDTAKFCDSCGTPTVNNTDIPPAQAPGENGYGVDPQYQKAAQYRPANSDMPPVKDSELTGRWISPNIVLCGDGKYRWIYEVSLFKNPTIFLLVWKIFFFIVLGIFVFMLIIDAANGDLDGERALDTLKFFGIFTGGMTALVAVSYLIYAAVMGGKYIVIFEMDDEGVNHKQLPKQAKKAEAIGMLTALIGLASHNVTTVGVGLNSTRTEMYSGFSTVRKIKAYPRRHLIKVNGLIEHNQVYAAPEDFEFVLGFIRAHVPDRKK